MTGFGHATRPFTFVLACALPWLIGANLTAPAIVTLGVTEGTLSYCGPINPALAAKLREKIVQLTQGASEPELAAVRASESYRKAYESVAAAFAQSSERDNKRICLENPPERK